MAGLTAEANAKTSIVKSPAIMAMRDNRRDFIKAIIMGNKNIQ